MSGSAILEYLEARILKISPVGWRQPWWSLCGFDVCIGLPKKMLGTLLLGYTFVSVKLESRVNLPADSNFQHHEKKVVPQFLTKKRQTSLIEKRKLEICTMWKNQSVVSLGFWWEKVRATLRNLKFCYKLMYCHTITWLIRNLTLFCVSFFGCRFCMDGAAIYV